MVFEPTQSPQNPYPIRVVYPKEGSITYDASVQSFTFAGDTEKHVDPTRCGGKEITLSKEDPEDKRIEDWTEITGEDSSKTLTIKSKEYGVITEEIT